MKKKHLEKHGYKYEDNIKTVLGS